MNDLHLPAPIAAYFDADRRNGVAVARCFTGDGVVRDEGRTHSGRAAIDRWKTASSARYAYTAMPHTLESRGRSVVVTSRLTGNFPGSPLDLQFVFVLEDGKIASLEITP